MPNRNAHAACSGVDGITRTAQAALAVMVAMAKQGQVISFRTPEAAQAFLQVHAKLTRDARRVQQAGVE